MQIFTEDVEQIGQEITVTALSYSVEEPDYNVTEHVKIKYRDGRCPLTQHYLDSYPPQSIELRTSRAGKTVTASLYDALRRGREALQEPNFSFECGKIVTWF